jgi:hypothetical protein
MSELLANEITQRLVAIAMNTATTDTARLALVGSLVDRFLPECLRLAGACRLPIEPFEACAQMVTDGAIGDPLALLQLAYESELCEVLDPLVTGLTIAAHASLRGSVDARDLQEVIGGTLVCLARSTESIYAEVVTGARFDGAHDGSLLVEEERRLRAVIARPPASTYRDGSPSSSTAFARLVLAMS